MASRTHEVTLTANTVAAVVLDEAYESVRLVVLAATLPVWFTVDGSTPAIGADNSLTLAPVVGEVQEVQVPTGNAVSETTVGDGPTISLISGAAATVEIEGGY